MAPADRPLRQRSSLPVWALVSVVTLLGACSAAPRSDVSPSPAHGAPGSTAPIASGARVIATIQVPTGGPVGVGAGSVWVIDRGLGDTPDPAKAALLQVDPVTGEIVRRIDGVIGAAIAVTDNAIWVASARTDRLIRISVGGFSMTSIETGPTPAGADEDNYPYAVAATADGIWVANHHAGTIARIDPVTLTSDLLVGWGEAGGGGPAHLATDGSTIWVTASRSSEVTEIDSSTGQITYQTSVEPAGACGGLDVTGDAVWVASGYDKPFSCWDTEHQGLSRIDRATGEVQRIDVGARPADVRVAFGSVWVLTDDPTTALLRLDPATYQVIGRLPLEMRPDYSNPLAIGFEAIWVRLIAPDGDADGTLLRIQPEG